MSEHSPVSPASAAATDTTALGQRIRNLLIVLVALALAIAVFLGVRTQTPTASLSALAESAVPLEAAMTNGKPSLVEFYANWCTSCQAMAGDMTELHAHYGDDVNFVMLNVDNSKWLPEMLRYRVDGIPHFVYLDSAGHSLGSAIGEQPRLILAQNLDALIADQPLPHQQVFGKLSDLDQAAERRPNVNDDPRSHGAQVVN